LTGEAGEFLSYFPEHINMFDQMTCRWNNYLNVLRAQIDSVSQRDTKNVINPAIICNYLQDKLTPDTVKEYIVCTYTPDKILEWINAIIP
jgi:hypothetical protein